MIFCWLAVIQLGYWRQRSILSVILWPRTWGGLNTFWGLKLHIKNIVYFFLNKSIFWIFWRKQDFLGCKPASTLMKANVDLWFDDSHTFDDPERYKRLIEKLIYLTITKPDIIFVVTLSRFMHQPREVRWSVAPKILPYIKSYPRKSLVYRKRRHARIYGYSNSVMLVTKTFVGGNLVTWRSKSKILYLARVQKPGIESWLILPVRWFA